MTIESELFTRLSTFAGLAALTSTRVYPVVAPQNVAKPYLIFRQAAANRESGFGGDVGLVQSRYEIVAYDSSYRGVRDVVRQVRLAMQRWHNPAGDPAILDCFVVDFADGFVSEVNLYETVADIDLWHRE